MTTRFKVYYAVFNSHQNIVLGEAKLTGNRVTFKANPEKHKWFEIRPDDYLKEVRGIIRQLCKSVGHTGKYFSSWHEDSGIGVERLEQGITLEDWQDRAQSRTPFAQ